MYLYRESYKSIPEGETEQFHGFRRVILLEILEIAGVTHGEHKEAPNSSKLVESPQSPSDAIQEEYQFWAKTRSHRITKFAVQTEKGFLTECCIQWEPLCVEIVQVERLEEMMIKFTLSNHNLSQNTSAADLPLSRFWGGLRIGLSSDPLFLLN